MWSACQNGEEELYFQSLEKLLDEIKICDNAAGYASEDKPSEPVILVTLQDLIKLINDQDSDGNTMLHHASISNQLKTIWYEIENF